jgi:hypothetical protein
MYARAPQPAANILEPTQAQVSERRTRGLEERGAEGTLANLDAAIATRGDQVPLPTRRPAQTSNDDANWITLTSVNLRERPTRSARARKCRVRLQCRLRFPSPAKVCANQLDNRCHCQSPSPKTAATKTDYEILVALPPDPLGGSVVTGDARSRASSAACSHSRPRASNFVSARP